MGGANAPNLKSAAKALSGSTLFSPIQVGCMNLEHRVCMAPLGRLRATEVEEGEWICNEVNAQYYGQRATKGGFQITESTPISRLVG